MADANKVAAVVGVGAGVGNAPAGRVAKEYAVALVARGADKLEGFAKEIEGEGGKALAVAADVSETAEIEAAFARIRSELGDVDVLLYNAAMRPFGRLMETK